MTLNPWVKGFYELLEHGIDHFLNETEFDRRLAMINIDNALELAIKTYISQNLRVFNIKHKDFNNIKKDFSKLLDMLLKIAPDKISDNELSGFEHYHSLRNNLYHEGIGISVDKNIVKEYGEKVIRITSNLFEVDLGNLFKRLQLEKFIKKYKRLQALWQKINLSIIYLPLYFELKPNIRLKKRINELVDKKIISEIHSLSLVSIIDYIKKIESKEIKISYIDLEEIDEIIIKAIEIERHIRSLIEEIREKEYRNAE